MAKEDIQLIKMAAKKEAKTAVKKGSGIKASSEGRKSGAPETSLSLSFVHGCVCMLRVPKYLYDAVTTQPIVHTLA